MPSVIGDLAVNVTTSTASLEVGMARAADIVSQSAKRMTQSFDDFNGRIDAIGGALKALTGIVSVGYGAHLFAGMIEGAIDAQAHLQDLADKAGTTASSLSSLIPAAKLSGTSMDDVAAASAKFSKQLVDIQSGTGKAAQAFQSLGFSSRDAARFLKDPVQGLFELSKRANEFANDGNKVAAVQLVMGKGAADLAKFMKQLSEQQTLTARVTDEQAQAAKKLQDEYATLQLRGDDLKNSIASGLVPELSRLLQLFTDSTGGPQSLGVQIKALAADGSLAIWAHEAAIAIAVFGESLIAIGSAARAFGGSVDTIISDLRVLTTATNNPDYKLTGAIGFSKEEAEKGRADFAQALSDRNNTLADANDRYNKLISGSFTAFSDSLKQQLVALQAQRTAIRAGVLGDLADIPGQSGPVRPPIKISVDTTGVSDQLGKVKKQLDDLEDKWRNLFAAKLTGVEPGTIKSLEELDTLLSKGRLSWDEYVKGIGLALDADKTFDAEQKLLNETLAAFFKLMDDIEASMEPGTKAFDDRAEALKNSTASLVQQNEQLRISVATVGMTAQQTIVYTAAQERLKVASLDVSDALKQEALAAIDANESLQLAKVGAEDYLARVREFDSAAHDAFLNVAEHGKDAFKDIGASIKRYIFDQLYQLALRPFVVQIAAQVFGGGGAGAAGGTGGIASLFSGGSGNIVSGIANLFGTGGTASVGIGSAVTSGLTSIFGAGGVAAGAGLEAGAGAAAGFGSAAAGAGGVAGLAGTAVAAIPVVGWVAAAAAIAYSIYSANKKPSPTEGQFQISAGTGGFEDNFSTASRFGNIGFADQGTKQFSGEAAQAFNNLIATALDTFEQRYSPEQSARLATILQSTAFPHFEGTFSTEDFIKQYGGDIFKQVVQAAFDVLDPALGSIVKSFTGTADELTKFSGTLLAINDASAAFGDDFKANIVAALADATQGTADKVLAFVGIVQQFGTAIDGLGPKLQALDAGSITAFIDALGGAQAALNSFAYLSQNFLTSSQRLAQAQTQLTQSFDALSLKVPATHQGFLDLLASFDLTTASGRALYASVLALAPLFIQVAGTADSAATAVRNVVALKPSLADIGRTAIETGNAIAAAVTTINLAIQDLQDAASKAQASYQASIAAINSVVSASPGDFGDKTTLRMELLQEQVAKYTALLNSTIATAPYSVLVTAYQGILRDLGKQNQGLAASLAQFTILKAQYGASIADQLVALQASYDEQHKALAGNVAALAALDANFKTAWDNIIKGVGTGVDGTIGELAKLQQGIRDYLDGLRRSDLNPASASQRLIEAQAQYQKQLGLAKGGDLGALGSISQYADALLKLAQQVFPTAGGQYAAIFQSILNDLSALSNYTPAQPAPVSTAQVNAAIAAAMPSVAIASGEDVDNQTQVLGAKVDALADQVTTLLAQIAAGARQNTQDQIDNDNAVERKLESALVGRL